MNCPYCKLLLILTTVKNTIAQHLTINIDLVLRYLIANESFLMNYLFCPVCEKALVSSKLADRDCFCCLSFGHQVRTYDNGDFFLIIENIAVGRNTNSLPEYYCRTRQNVTWNNCFPVEPFDLSHAKKVYDKCKKLLVFS